MKQAVAGRRAADRSRRPRGWSRSAPAPTSRRCAATRTAAALRRREAEDRSEGRAGSRQRRDGAGRLGRHQRDPARRYGRGAAADRRSRSKSGGVPYMILGQLGWFVREKLAEPIRGGCRQPSRRCSARISSSRAPGAIRASCSSGWSSSYAAADFFATRLARRDL